MIRIPLTEVKYDEAEKESVAQVLDSGWITNGPKVAEFENEFAKLVGSKYAVAVNSCTAALHLALAALGIGAGDEVIMPALTFIAGYNSIRYIGAKPVLADITNTDDLTLSPENCNSLITPKTKAIIPMHYGGYLCDMEKLSEISKSHNLIMIEDAAHAPGSELNGKYAGTWGNSGCFSFFGNKNLVTGEGGMVTTNDKNLSEKIKLMRSHGMTATSWDKQSGHAFAYDVVEEGFNYRMTEITAAIGLTQLGKLQKHNQIRKKLVEYYRENLKDVSPIQIPFTSYRGTSSFHLFVILVENSEIRKTLMEFLLENGIGTSIHYPPLYEFTRVKKELIIPEDSLRITKEVSNRIITLPLHPFLSKNDIDYISEKIKKFFRNKK